VFKVEMLARKAGWWISDGKRFPDMREANKHANSLVGWGFVKAVRIVPVSEGNENN
jgi:hypothetical protein